MKRKYFIIDDDILQNQIHSLLLKKVDPNAEIRSFQTCKTAIAEIKQGVNPEIIFLDLNIPGEGVADFLDYHLLASLSGDIYLISSAAYMDNPEIMTRYPAIKGFISKPLLDYKIKSILGDAA